MIFIPDILSLKEYTFHCQRCGKCCKVLNITDANKKGILYKYDYKGKFTTAPTTSVTVHYDEKKIIESNHKLSKPSFIPYETYFLKSFPYEFVHTYQIKTKKGWCIFYDLQEKKCSIYSLRPSVCKAYPLYVDFLFMGKSPCGLIPNITKCSDVDSEIRKRYPRIENIMNVIFEIDTQYKAIFPNCFNHFKNLVYKKFAFTVFWKVWGDLFLSPLEVHPEIVINYKKLDFSRFWGWISAHKHDLGAKNCALRVKKYKNELDILKAEF
ncbi:MAG: YkgJ family cysteine cluster protein [Promethearchaeota archaeon]